MTKRNHDEESSEPFAIMRTELNYLHFPLFTLDRQKLRSKAPYTAPYTVSITTGKEKTTRTLTVTPDPTLGLGGPFDFRAFRAVEKLLSDLYHHNSLSRQVSLSPHSVLATMGYRVKGSNEYARLSRFFTRMKGLRLISDGALYDRGREAYLTTSDQVPPIYEDVIVHPKGVTLVLGELYWRNLENKHVKLIDYSVYKYINSPLAKRLFELISPRAFRYPKKVYFNYATLCAQLPIAHEGYPSEVDKQLKSACEHLIKLHVLTGVVNDVTRRNRYAPDRDRRIDGRVTFVMHEDFRDNQVNRLDKESAEEGRMDIDPYKM